MNVHDKLLLVGIMPMIIALVAEVLIKRPKVSGVESEMRDFEEHVRSND